MSKLILLLGFILLSSCSHKVTKQEKYIEREISSLKLKNELTIDQIQTIRMLGHNNIPRIVVVYAGGRNLKTLNTFFEVIYRINQTIPANEKIKIVIGGDTSINIHDLNLRYEVAESVLYGYMPKMGDHWLQDFGEILAVKTSVDDREKLMVLDSNRGRGLEEIASFMGKAFNLYYYKPDNNSKTNGNYGGNIEVTPNNILYIGNTSTNEMRTFFSSHGYEKKMVVLDTSWLDVGHVDEYISTVVIPNDSCGFAILKADPKLGLNMIKATHENQDFEFPEYQDYYKQQIIDLKKAIGIGRNISGSEVDRGNRVNYNFVKNQMKISVIVDKNIEILKQKIKEHTPGCSTVKIVSIPQIFSCSEDPGKSNSRSCLSTLPGAINMLNLRGNLIIPNTYYRPFNLYIKKQLELLGQKVFFTDDLELYHDGAGEIHCGTNVLREPNKYLRKIGSN